MLRSIESFVQRADVDLRSLDLLDLIPRLTLVLLILFAGSYWYLAVPLRVLCIGALLYKPLYRSGVFWFLASCFLVASNLENWYTIDNHKYLMTYWAIVLTVVFFRRDEERQRTLLARNAKVLIGLCMAFATLWKVISPDYLNSSFFHHTLLTDSRFASVSEAAGGLGARDFYRNRALTRMLVQGTRDERVVGEVTLASTPRIGQVSRFLTWWTVCIEGLLAIAFLLPARWGPPARWRHLLLLLFAISTYSVATVIGFAWLLIIMAVAELPARYHRLRLAYVAVFLLMLVYTGPWASIFMPVFYRLGGVA